ncbi:hypothetical protein PACTADRAFT_50912 [Pachysolen tannophilus NRRL Y-2460]|uniref:Uncharacterized protein n=1 Tax=Pachysolen tannophilus NRRL Y-2460 TaxID=669874 RepID=A0A1E4TTS9_PACTA|nr:hypothetical protein PACTADRAFT_50912 [Pachysolen tannophilus NRRL Y-2460]
MSWIKPLGNSSPSTAHVPSSSILKNEKENNFFQLPVIRQGSGLSLDESSNNKEEINTIGDFINGNKKISLLNKKKPINNNNNNNSSGIYKKKIINQNDNRATIALKNKMRKTSREISKKNRELNFLTKPAIISNNDVIDDSSDEEEKIVKSTKKKINLLI